MSAQLCEAALLHRQGTAARLWASTHRQVLIVESNPTVCDRMRRIFATVSPGAQVVAAWTRGQACEMLAGQAFTLMLVGLDGPACDGVPLILQVQKSCPHIEIVAMAETDNDRLVGSAIAAGAIGYLLTEADDAELALLLHALDRGGAPIDSRIARRMLGSIAASARSRPGLVQNSPAAANKEGGAGLLSPRELKVLRLIAQGWSNRQIAEAVYLSVNTIEFHAKSIYRKLSVRSRTQAVHRARQLALIDCR